MKSNIYNYIHINALKYIVRITAANEIDLNKYKTIVKIQGLTVKIACFNFVVVIFLTISIIL